MTLNTSPGAARLGRQFRQLVLVLFALFVAHDAIYVAEFGIGDGFARAMTAGGHDGYWTPVTLVIGVGAALIFVATLSVLVRLERRSAVASGSAASPSYIRELGSIWLRLLPVVALLFGLQENIEQFVRDGHIAGLDPLFGLNASVVVPVLALVTLALAALGALIRWRIHILHARIRAQTIRAFGRPVAALRSPRWAAIAAAVAHGWILARSDAGRAPPSLLSISSATA